MADRQVKVRLVASVTEYQRDLAKASLTTRALSRDMLAVAGTRGMDRPARDVAALGKATEKAADASSKLKESQLRAAAAQDRLTALRVSGKASTQQLATAEAGLIAAERKVAAAQKDGADAAAVLSSGVADHTQALSDQQAAMVDVGQAAALMGGAVGAGLAVAANAAMSWETGWAGVTKTVNGSAPEMADLETQLRGLAKTLPLAHEEIAGVAEAAGQLGVQREAIAGFTKVMIDLGETTNLTADEAATNIAQLMNVMGTAPDEVDNLGAALVALGNAGASTEAQILDMAQRLAGAGALIGASESDVLALANAMASMGIEAELGGGAMSRVILRIESAAAGGEDSIKQFSDVAGMSAQAFLDAWENDPIRAVDAFVQGLNKIDQAGGNVIGALDGVGIKGTQDLQVLLRLKGAGDLLSSSLDLGAQAWKANTALLNEANKRYATTESQIQVAKNAVHDLGIELGSFLLPAIAKTAGGVGDLAAWFGGLPDPIQAAFVILATLTATIGLFGGAALMAVGKVAALEANLIALGVSADGAALAMSRLGLAAKSVVAVGALAAITVAAVSVANALAAPPPAVDKLTASLQKFTEQGILSGSALAVVGHDFDDFASTLDRAQNGHGTLRSFFDFDLSDIGGKTIEAKQDIEALDQSLAAMVAAGNGQEAARIYGILADKAKAAGQPTDAMTSSFTRYGTALAAANQQAGPAAAGLDATGVAAGGAATKVEELSDAQKHLQDALASFIDPLGAYNDLVQSSAEQAADAQSKSVDRQIEATNRNYDARIEAARKIKGGAKAEVKALEDQRDATVKNLGQQRKSWQDYAADTKVSLSQVADALEGQLKAQADWQSNLAEVARRAGPEVAQILAEMGKDGVALTAKMADGTAREVNRMAALLTAGAASAGEGATRSLDEKLKVMAVVGALGAKATGKSVSLALAGELKVGADEVVRIAAGFGQRLQSGVNPLLVALGKAPISQGTGGTKGLTLNADGNLYEDHSAQIAPAGAMRLWAEPETGGEAYIPLAPGKRSRSVAIWEETGRRLGQFADGGFHEARDIPRPPSTAPYGPPVSTAGDRTMGAEYKSVLDYLTANLEPTVGASGGVHAAQGGGDLVAFGHQLQAMGARVSEHPAFGGVHPVHAKNSKHYLGRAIDVNTRPGTSALEQSELAPMAEMARAAGLGTIFMAPGHFNHLHVDFAEGGILNPHVRDAGGPLMPGYTFNGTGRPEMVLPFAAGAVVAKKKLPPLGPRSTVRLPASPIAAPHNPLSHNATLAGDLSRLPTVSAMEKLIDAWKRYGDAAEAAHRRAELVTDVRAAQREYDTARGIEARTSALGKLNEATAAVTSFDRDYRAQQAQARADDVLAARQAKEEAAAAAKAAKISVEDNKFEVGDESTSQRLATLDRRLAGEKKYSDAWTSIWTERQRLLEEQATAEQAVLDKQVTAQEKAADDAQQAADKAADEQQKTIDRLNELLDQESTLRGQLADGQAKYNDDLDKLHAEQVVNEAEFYTAQADLVGTREAARATALDAAHSRELDAAREYQDAQQQVLDARRSQLAEWARIDQAVVPAWGNTIDQLVGNAADQAAQFAEWMGALADARRRGVSEAVIGSLGLDQGPQALGQLRQFADATVEQIDALNQAVAARTTAAGAEVATEQAGMYGQVGAGLAAATATYSQAIAASQAQLAAALQQADREYADSLTQLQQKHADDQARLSDEMATLQTEFLASQAEMTAQLAVLGQDHGRAYGEALAAGLLSSLPGVQAAAAELQAVTAALTAAQAAASVQAAALVTAQTAANHGLAPSAGVAARTQTYDVGGWLQPGFTLAYNGTGSPERVLTASQASAGGAGGGPVQVRVFIGERELTDIVDVQVGSTLGRQRSSSLIAGTRAR